MTPEEAGDELKQIHALMNQTSHELLRFTHFKNVKVNS